MIEKSHNITSKQFMQKILLYIDTVLINVAKSDSADCNKILTAGLLNVRDALFSEILNDNSIDKFNSILLQEENKKKLQKEENQKDLNQEAELDKDQLA